MRNNLFGTIHTNIMSNGSAMLLSVRTFTFVVDHINMRVEVRPAKPNRAAWRFLFNANKNACSRRGRRKRNKLVAWNLRTVSATSLQTDRVCIFNVRKITLHKLKIWLFRGRMRRGITNFPTVVDTTVNLLCRWGKKWIEWHVETHQICSIWNEGRRFQVRNRSDGEGFWICWVDRTYIDCWY